MQIKIKNVSKSYRNKKVLESVSLETAGGRCIGILGSNGSGKSTLLSVLAGVLERDDGAFLFNGQDLFQMPEKRATLIGYVPQGMPLIEELTAKDNLLLWYDRKTMEKELDGGILSLLGIGEFLKIPVRKLSVGMKKRLCIGCAMAGRPPVLLLDEPTAALDMKGKRQIAQYLLSYKRSGGLVLLVTHDEMELKLCDEWYILKNGVLESFDYQGDVQQILDRI